MSESESDYDEYDENNKYGYDEFDDYTNLNRDKIARECCDSDWRSFMPSLIDRFKHVCLHEELSDADFVFNKGSQDETVQILFLVLIIFTF